ncbi:MAG: AI-2E family transporter [Clostridia bacterium]|nr:AI-2E family transporter [Clostridia bacterium]
MKPEWNKKYATIAMYSFLTVAALILFLSLIVYRESVLEWIGSFLSVLRPVIYGVVIAYLLAPMDRFIYRALKRSLDKSKRKLPQKLLRVISIISSYIVFVVMIAGFLFLVVPQIGKSLEEISSKLPEYYNTVSSFVLSLDIPWLNIPQNAQEFEKYLGHVYDLAKGVVPQLYSFLEGLVTEVMNFVIGILISIYVLWGRVHFKKRCVKLMHSVFENDTVKKVTAFGNRANRIFSGFISGKILDSVIVGIIAFIVMTILGLPYATLISVIVGVTNVIPVFGPFIGAIPSSVIILLVEPEKTLWFIIMIIALQQLDGNVIGPKILGETTGLPAFWVVFSLIVFGGFFGVLGMLVAVPLCALAYNGIKDFSEKRLENKGMPTETDAY